MNIMRRAVRGLVGQALDSADARRQRSRLHALDDHMLRDLGITRDQIDAAFRGRLDPAARA